MQVLWIEIILRLVVKSLKLNDMLEVLFIKLIHEFDQPIFGANIFNLARLARLGFPVANGIAISPPALHLNTVLEKYDIQDKEIFEQSLTLIKSEIVKTPIPEILDKELKNHKCLYLDYQYFKDKKTVWLKLLEIWLNEIRNKIWRQGFLADLTKNLTPQLVFFVDQKNNFVKAHFDPDLKDVVIDPRLKPAQLQEIDEIVTHANKKLFIPQTYEFLVDKKIFLVGLNPFTHTIHTGDKAEVIIPKNEQKKIVRSAAKIFLDLSGSLMQLENVDGVLFKINQELTFDEIVLKLWQIFEIYPNLPVILQLPDDKNDEVRGSLRLIHSQQTLQKITQAFLFLRNKRHFLNLQLALPLARSAEEYLLIKKELAIKGVKRLGLLKFYLEMAVPENFINIEQYLMAGLDGVIINLDELFEHIVGFKVEEGEYYKHQVQTLTKFLKDSLKIIHKAKIHVIARGELTKHPDVLDFLIDSGIWAILVGRFTDAQSMPELLHLTERRIIIKKLHSFSF